MDNQFIVENIETFIEEKPITTKMLKDIWFLIAFFGFLPSILGIFYYITIPIFIITMTGMIIWGNKVINQNRTNQFMLYIGTGLIITSLECLLAVYKIFAINKLSLIEGLLITFIYIIFITVYSMSYVKKLSHENIKKKRTTHPFIFAGPLMGILIGRRLGDVMNNNQAFLLLAIINLILSLLMGMGVKYIINYYYIRKHKIV